MTISQLIKALEGIKESHPRATVVLSSDSEGNSYHPADNGLYVNELGPGQVVIWPSHETVEIS